MAGRNGMEGVQITIRFIFATCVVLSFALCSAVGDDSLEGRGPNPTENYYSDAHRFVFFAVLEGCYTDGLIEWDMDLIIPKHPNGHRDMLANFVLSCPLCAPAADAFKLYAERNYLSIQPSKAARHKTFGRGLDKAVKAELAKPG
jgi:hypothetical protein